MFLIIVIIIAILSIFLAVISLKKENTRKEIDRAKRDLSKNRVIFQKKD